MIFVLVVPASLFCLCHCALPVLLTVVLEWNSFLPTQAICTLLQLDAEAFRKGICSRLIVAGTEKMVKQEGADKAKQGRDALAKALYSRLFDHVVQCVNRALRVKGTNKVPTLQVCSTKFEKKC